MAHARWRIWQLRYPALRQTPPVALGPGASIAVIGAGEVSVGVGLRALADLTLSVRGRLAIGDRVFIGRGTNIACLRDVEIGDDVRFAERVSVHDSDHVIEPLADWNGRQYDSVARPVRIGHRVWLAANVVVTPGVTIGDDSVVAAGSVVTRDIPSGVLAGGVPAKVLRGLRPS